MTEVTAIHGGLVPAHRNPAAVYLGSLNEATSRATMLPVLDRLAGMLSGGACDHLTLPWHEMRTEQVAAAAAMVRREEWAPATKRKHLVALRRTLWWSWKLGWIDAETRDRAADIEKVTGGGPAAGEAGRALRAGEMAALFESCMLDSGPLAARDAALLALLYGQGVRRAEAASLDLDDIDYGVDPPALTVRGKRAKTRVLYLNPGVVAAVGGWLAQRGAHTGPLLHPVRKGGDIQASRRLTGAGIYEALRARAAKAGVSDFTPHDLRRTFAGDMLDHVDIATVRDLLGHSSANTTAGYDRRGAIAKQKAAGVLHVPYGG